MDIVIGKPNENRELEKIYTQNERIPTGSIRGFCFVAQAPGQAGANADVAASTAGAQPREVEYYNTFKYPPPVWISKEGSGEGRFPLMGAALMLRGVKIGPKAPMDRPGFKIYNGGLYPFAGHWFGMLSERLQFRNNDPFACKIVISALDGGKVIEDAAMEAFALTSPNGIIGELTAWNKHTEPGGSNTLTGWQLKARHQLTPAIRQMGVYNIVCKRHAWQQAYYIVVDNPYIAVSSNGHNGWGKFSIDQIPVGRHKLEAWHPAFEMAQKTIDVDIRDTESTAVTIEFKPAGK